MKKAFLFFPVLLLAIFLPANGQNVKSILKKHFEAVGQSAIVQAEAIVITGKISQMGMELPFTVYQKKPGKVRFDAVFEDKNLIQAFDGEKGWTVNPMSGPEPVDMGISEVKNMKSMAEIEGKLYNWKKKKYKVSYEGTEDFGGVNMYKLKVITSDEETMTYFISTDDYLISKVDAKNKVQGMDVESSKIYSDYREIQGFRFPFKNETFMMGQSAGDLEILSFEIKKAKDVDDKLFVKPISK